MTASDCLIDPVRCGFKLTPRKRHDKRRRMGCDMNPKIELGVLFKDFLGAIDLAVFFLPEHSYLVTNQD